MKTKPFPNGTEIRDALNDGLILTIIGHEARGDSFAYYAADPSPNVRDWIISHDEITSGERWTVLGG